MAHIFEVFKKGSLVIVAHTGIKVSLVIVAHEKSDRPYLWLIIIPKIKNFLGTNLFIVQHTLHIHRDQEIFLKVNNL